VQQLFAGDAEQRVYFCEGIFIILFNVFLRYSMNINCVGKTHRIARVMSVERFFPTASFGRSDLHIERRVQLL